jgi:hypothetical protein
MLLNNLIKALEDSEEIKWAWEEFTDALVVEKLKDTYITHYNGDFSGHPEDVQFSKELAKACDFVLSYFMVSFDHKEFIEEVKRYERQSN